MNNIYEVQDEPQTTYHKQTVLFDNTVRIGRIKKEESTHIRLQPSLNGIEKMANGNHVVDSFFIRATTGRGSVCIIENVTEAELRTMLNYVVEIKKHGYKSEVSA